MLLDSGALRSMGFLKPCFTQVFPHRFRNASMDAKNAGELPGAPGAAGHGMSCI